MGAEIACLWASLSVGKVETQGLPVRLESPSHPTSSLPQIQTQSVIQGFVNIFFTLSLHNAFAGAQQERIPHFSELS